MSIFLFMQLREVRECMRICMKLSITHYKMIRDDFYLITVNMFCYYIIKFISHIFSHKQMLKNYKYFTIEYMITSFTTTFSISSKYSIIC